MSGELEIHRVASRFVGEVRLVYQQDNEFIAGDGLQS
jgi:hypothetical protein